MAANPRLDPLPLPASGHAFPGGRLASARGAVAYAHYGKSQAFQPVHGSSDKSAFLGKLKAAFLRGFRSGLPLSDTASLINLSNESHPPCVGVSHNDDFVVAFTKLDEPLPGTDRCFRAAAVIFVVAAVRNIDFSHQFSPFILVSGLSRRKVLKD